jgi:hypothetical protein
VSDAKIRPGKYWYLIGAAILILGVGAFVWGIVSFVQGGCLSMGEPFSVPGQKELTLESPGTYNILLDDSHHNGERFVEAIRDNLLIVVIRKEDDVKIPIRSVSPAITVSQRGGNGDRIAKVLWDFPIQKPGVYVICGHFLEGDPAEPQASLSVSPEIWDQVEGAVRGFVLFGLGGLGSLTIFIATPILRGRCKRRLAAVPVTAPTAAAPIPPPLPPAP